MLPVARLSDTFADDDVITTGSGNVFVNNLPVARLSDVTTGHSSGTCFWPAAVINSGSGKVFVNNLPIARLSDTHTTHCCGSSCHDSVITTGSGNVFSG